VKDIQAKLCASKIFPTEKSSKRNLRGAYITHINGDRVFTVEEATEKLLKLFQQSKDHNHGGDLGDTTNSLNSSDPTSASKNHFSFQITYAPERKLTGKRLKRAIDDYYDLAPGTTKSIKQKPEEMDEDQMKDVDDGSERFPTGTKIYKVFNEIEYAGEVTGYDNKSKLYHIKYEDGDLEDFFHNEVKEHQNHTVPMKQRWNRQKQIVLQSLISKLAPDELDYEEHVMKLDFEAIRAITELNSGLDCSEDEVPSEMLRMVVNTLNSSMMTPEEEALGHFTRKRLQKLSTWDEWEKGEHKQLNQFEQQQMFGDPIDAALLPKDAVILRPHWQYAVKRSGV